jgi:hypothetical protein
MAGAEVLNGKKGFGKFLDYFYSVSFALSLSTFSNIIFDTNLTFIPIIYLLLAILTFLYFLEDGLELMYINKIFDYEWDKSLRRLFCDILIIIFIYLSISALKAKQLELYVLFFALAFLFSRFWAHSLKRELGELGQSELILDAYESVYKGCFWVLMFIFLWKIGLISCERASSEAIKSLASKIPVFSFEISVLVIVISLYVYHDVYMVLKINKSNYKSKIDFPTGLIGKIVLYVVNKLKRNNN